MNAREAIGRWWRRAQWALVPLAVFGAAEAAVRATVDHVPSWYGAAERLAAAGPLGALFVGSSRVQAAVVTDAFAKEAAARGRPGLTVLNLGRGYSTDVEHFLGLRNLIAAHPEHLRGATVFLEAPGGLPFVTRWPTATWARSEQPWMIVDLLTPADLAGFWRSPALAIGERVHVSVRLLLRHVALVNRRERVREAWFDSVLPGLAMGQEPALGIHAPLGDDLRGPWHTTSIRADPATVALARDLARQASDQMAAGEAPIRQWAGTITEDLVRMVRQGGGRVVFFDLPQSAVFQRVYQTPVRREDAAVFAVQARAWGACRIDPSFSYSDDDLPDYWHLRPERAAEYTRALAAAWADTCDPAS